MKWKSRRDPNGKIGDERVRTKFAWFPIEAGDGYTYWLTPVVVHELPAERLRPAYLLRRAYAQGRSDWRLDADVLAPRRLHGARVPLEWGVAELRRRARERGQGRATLFHTLCDVARTAGGLREAATRQ